MKIPTAMTDFCWNGLRYRAGEAVHLIDRDVARLVKTGRVYLRDDGNDEATTETQRTAEDGPSEDGLPQDGPPDGLPEDGNDGKGPDANDLPELDPAENPTQAAPDEDELAGNDTTEKDVSADDAVEAPTQTSPDEASDSLLTRIAEGKRADALDAIASTTSRHLRLLKEAVRLGLKGDWRRAAVRKRIFVLESDS